MCELAELGLARESVQRAGGPHRFRVERSGFAFNAPRVFGSGFCSARAEATISVASLAEAWFPICKGDGPCRGGVDARVEVRYGMRTREDLRYLEEACLVWRTCDFSHDVETWRS